MGNKIGDIKDISSLDELLEYDKLILRTCKQFVCKVNYQDIVQETYLRLSSYFNNGKVVTGSYILMIMKSINIDNIRKRKTSPEDLFELLYNENDNDINYKVERMDNILNLILDKNEINFIKFVSLHSIKETSELYGISERVVKYKKKTIKEKINKMKSIYFKNI